jgi:superfamily II DNA or RNA helicase
MTKQDELQQKFIDRTIKFFKTNKAGYLDLAMRFGKCRTTIEVLKKMVKKNEWILIAYPDNKLKQTWMDEMDLWDYDHPNIEFVNFSSLKKHVGQAYDFVIIDEFHSCSENERELAQKILEAADHTLCLSGTISDDTRFDWELMEIASYSTQDGIRDGILADYQISVHLVELDDLVKVKDKKGKEKTEKKRYADYTYVIEKLKREGANFMHLALSRNRLSQSSIGKMNHLKKLLSKLHDKRVLVFTGLANVADSIGIPSYHSKSKDDLAYREFQSGEVNHLALAAMGKVGVTYKALDSVILLNFTYNAEESSQILNRAIKLDYHGKIADLHIICLNEPPELKKIKESLSMLNQSKIKYL